MACADLQSMKKTSPQSSAEQLWTKVSWQMICISNVSGFNDGWLEQLNGINEGNFFWGYVCVLGLDETRETQGAFYVSSQRPFLFVWDFTAAHKTVEETAKTAAREGRGEPRWLASNGSIK